MEAILIITGLIFLTLVYFVGVYNRLVKHKNMVREAWSGIDVMLKKRHGLIPNLVETVKGYTNHEQKTLDLVVQARSRALGANSVKEKELAENTVDKALMNLLIIAEQYPDLKASSNFQEIQRELASLEGDIARSRRYYNGTSRDFTILVESFPSNLVANAFKFEMVSYFEIDNPEQRNIPHIQF